MKMTFPFRPALFKVAGASLLAAVTLVTMAQAQPPEQSQSFQQVAPKQPEKTGEGRVVNEAAAKPLASHADNEVLVGRLQGIFLLSNPKQVRHEGVTSHRSVEPGDIALAKSPDFDAAVQPYIGQPVTMKSLAELTRSIVAFFREHDRPVVNVFVPEQSITSGFVQVVVVVSRVEKVDATGARYFSNPMLRAEVRLRPGDQISSSQLNSDLSWINRNPFLQSDILMAPGNPPGTTDLLLRTQDRFPLRIYTGFEDSGNQYTGNDRILTGFNYGNLFGIGQQLSYQFTTGTDVNKFTAHSGTYIIPLPWRHQLTFFGSYSESSATLGPDLSTGGVNWQVSGRYEIPLPGTEKFTESVTGGFDFKRSNNDLIFGVATVSNVFTDVDQFVLSYQAAYRDDYGSTSASATGFWSPGGLSNNDDDADYMATRAGARSNYAYGQFTLNRVTRLPFDFTWTVRGEVQESDANLLPSEQLGLGGYQTVRGYDERAVNGDNGFLVSTEVATPPVSIAQVLGIKNVKDQLQFLGFVDYGGSSLQQVTPADLNAHNNLLSVGPGFRYVINPYLSIRFDYGFQLIDANIANTGSVNTGFDTHRNSRAHLGVLVSY
jgi:hemolysin activation/secretion protein